MKYKVICNFVSFNARVYILYGDEMVLNIKGTYGDGIQSYNDGNVTTEGSPNLGSR